MELITLACTNNGSDIAPVFIILFVASAIFVALIVTVIKILLICKIFSKAGFSWALGLLMLVPIANIVMGFYLAFADWPALKELRQLKQPASPKHQPSASPRGERGEQQKS
jgi:magnesium-transporting ATPase (P-type)